MRNFWPEVAETLKTHFTFNKPFRKSCNYGTMHINIEEPDRPYMTICHMHIACWIPKFTNTLREYVVLMAFSWQKWLHERASMLRYMYAHCPSLDPRLRRMPSILQPLSEFKSVKSLCLHVRI